MFVVEEALMAPGYVDCHAGHRTLAWQPGGSVISWEGAGKKSERSWQYGRKQLWDFEAINRGVVTGVQSTAESLRVTQTGLLNWNIASILIGLIVVLVILAMGMGAWRPWT